MNFFLAYIGSIHMIDLSLSFNNVVNNVFMLFLRGQQELFKF